MLFHVLLNIPEMNGHRLPDVDLLQGSSQLLCQLAGIVIGSVCGSEAGHSHCKNIFPIKAKKVEASSRYQQCQRRIQTTRHPDHCLLAAGMLIPLFQSQRLDGKNLLAALLSLLLLCGNKGCAGKLPFKCCLFGI